jgi:arylsulfatase A-like enzyme
VRVPFILRWPGYVAAGKVNETSVIGGIDWLPTLCAITGVKIDAADFDGEDMSGIWLGKHRDRTHPLFWKTNRVQSDIGIRDGQWKLFHPTRKGEVELYDLSADPRESTNVAAQHPDIVRRLTAKVEQWQATLPKDYAKTPDND